LEKADLDDIGLKFLNVLARIGRISYRSISLNIGLTTKIVKSRVDRMLEAKVIEKFLVKINPFLDAKVKSRTFHEKVLQRIYEELNEQFMLSYDMSAQEDSIVLLLGSEDAAGIESIRYRIESSEGSAPGQCVITHKNDLPSGMGR